LLPPTFWEHHGPIILLAGLTGILVLTLLLFWRRRRLPAVSLPPEQIARETLRKLEGAPDNSILAGLVLHALRQYIPAALAWPPGELTAGEINLRLGSEKKFAAELNEEITVLLQQCEQRQFFSGRLEEAGRLAARALAVVEKIEATKKQNSTPLANQR
jgi:LPXTG-motif cell wall-anchored protein